MLYVFFVGSGTMMTLDMNLAMATVSALQVAIEQTCGIPVDNQVLLVSGGATLDPTVQVCTYGAGMDTNPIFLFAKCPSDTDLLQSMLYNNSDSDINMKERVDAFEKMADDYQTLTARTQLARDFADLATHERRLCNELVDSQHLQQQGWAAVIANLEDTAVAFKRHVDLLQSEAQQYFHSRPVYQDLLLKFPNAVDLLGKVPVLRSLTDQNEDENSESVQTLLTRYCTEPRAALETVAEQCNKWIHQFDEETLDHLNSELKNILHAAEEPSMKEVKGIEDRLFKLNKMMESAKKYADDQCKYAEALNSNLDRVSSSNDMSVLSDLCHIHQDQLNDMLKTHMCLRDIRDRCFKAKCELSENLQTRIRWISYIQNEIFNLNNKVAIYRENLRRLIDHLDVIQQIHLAPTIYMRTLAEIHRRKNFSHQFLKWAKSLSEQSLELYTKEVKARKNFNQSRSDNFVNNLFPGMDDLPPPFATECPQPFDQLLPDISQEDLEKLRSQLPELAAMMVMFPPEQMPQTSHKSIDSAFSSEVPSCQAAPPTSSCVLLPGGQLCRTETLSSLGAGEGLALASPTSSPFDETFMPPTELKKKSEETSAEPKRSHLAEGVGDAFSPIAEEQNNVESDGDEFERVDEVPNDTFMTCSNDKKQSDPIFVPCSGDAQRDNTKGSEGQFRSPDSNVTSHDFQSADYFIDDSMPSSYTESNSAVSRGQHKIKSHHIIVAELQHQLDEKQSALIGTQSSLKVSRSNLLLQCKLSALQKYMQDIKDKMKLDLKLLHDHVIEQRCTVTDEIAETMKNISVAISGLEVQIQSEKEGAINEILQKEAEKLDRIKKEMDAELKASDSKLSDALAEIENNQKTVVQLKTKIEELTKDYESEIEQLKKNHEREKADVLKNLVLGHELDIVEHEMALKNLREETTRELHAKDLEITNLKEIVANKQTHIQMLGIERETIEADLAQKFIQDQKSTQKSQLSYINQLEEQIQSDKTEIELLNKRLQDLETELRESFDKHLTIKLEEQEKCLMDKFDDEKKILNEKHMATLKENSIEIEQLKSVLENEKNPAVMNCSTQCVEIPDQSHPEVDKTIADIEIKLSELLATCTPEICELIHKFKEILQCFTSYQKEQFEQMKTQYLTEQQVKSDAALSLVIQEKDNLIDGLNNQCLLERKQQAMSTAEFNKVVQEKSSTIEDLKSRMSFLERKIENANSLIKSHLEGDVKRMTCSSSEALQNTGAKSKILKFQDASKILQEVQNVIDVPLMTNVETTFMEAKVQELEMKLKLEKLKCDQLLQKERMDKLSVLTCDRGDIVLFFFEETYNNYLAFHFGHTLHFLHSDSLETLNLKIPPEPNASWALTVIVDKEYCQAKKPGNRYKVPPGSRFYRIKVAKWNQEEARQFMMQPQVSALSWARSASVANANPPTSDASHSSKMSSSTI